MQYKSEKEFLENYDKSKFDLLSLTTDILILSISNEDTNNYRKLSKKYFSVLLVKRKDYPYKDYWCLPGGFMKIDEDIEESPKRILRSETNLHDIYLEQLYTYGKVDRDPRMRVISTSYMALVDKNRLNDKVNDNASWFKITMNETEKRIYITLDNDEEKIDLEISKTLKEKTTDRYKYDIIKSGNLAFDHALIIASGIERLKNKANYTDVVFNMMPTYFTLGELQQVYEVILNKKLLDPAFRRIIQNKVIKTDKVKTGEGHRPSALFKYNDKNKLK